MDKAETNNQDVPEPGATVGATGVEPKIAGSANTNLWRDRNFNLFWIGQTFDALGDSFALIAIPLLVLQATGSVAQMGLVTGVMGIGNLISGIISGFIADRMDRRRLLILCDVGRTLFYALIPICWWLMGPTIWLIYIVAGVTACLTTTFMITYGSAVPNLVGPDQLVAANGRLQGTIAVAFVAGPMLAGFASDRLSPVSTAIMIAATYIASTVFMFFVRLRNQAPVNATANAVAGSRKVDDLLAGIRFLMRHPILRSVTLLFSLFIFLSESMVDLSIFRLKQGLNQDDSSVGIVFGIASIGAIAAGVTAAALRQKFGFGLSLFGAMILQGVFIALIAIAPSVAVMAGLATVFTLGNTIMRVSLMSVRQQVTPDHLLGRVTSVFYIFYTVPGAIGAAISTAIAQKVGGPIVLSCIGVMAALVGFAGLLTSANTRRPEEVAPAAATESVPARP